jgi:glycerol-3-phosphate dehydrogenase (NAD(P)+)
MTTRTTILGSGGMGTALALLFARSDCNVTLWGRDPAHAAELARSRENAAHLPGVPIPESVTITADPAEALGGAELLVIAVPSAYLRATLGSIAGHVPEGVPAVSVVKGIENQTFARPSRIIVETVGQRPVAVLSGPSHAEEFARDLPASVVLAGSDEAVCVRVRDLLNRGMFRVYINPDALGVELAGALKNVLGIAAGICDGLGLGDNAKAALLTRGLAEITRFGVELGARQSTFFGLAGVGDVITTCYSRHGRNRLVGELIGKGQTLQEVLDGMTNVSEGVPTTRSVRDLARQRGVDVPITEQLYEVLFHARSPRSALIELMDRLPKVEWES